jgi:hypothetical protein
MRSRLDAVSVVRLEVDFAWFSAGFVELEVLTQTRRSVPRFPVLPRTPGLYRFWVESGADRPSVYIGEAVDLRQRMQRYRTPGAGQSTNLRVHAYLVEVISGGGRVRVDTAADVTVVLGYSASQQLDLGLHSFRLVAEQAALTEALLAEDLADLDDNPRVAPLLLNRPGVGEPAFR